MEDIYALLNINKGLLQGFPLMAERSVDHQTELTLNRNSRHLRNIEERMMADISINVSQRNIDGIITKVIENSIKNNHDWSIWSVREIRIVSYYLMRLHDNREAYQYALNLIDSNWRDMFFNGLSFYCLDYWHKVNPEIHKSACNLLTRKLQNYAGDNRKYIAMKNHVNLFEDAGPIRMSVLLCQKRQDVKEAPMYFGNRQSTINQSYYSDVILYFLNKNNITDLDYIEEVLLMHSVDRTKKLVLADLVIRVNDLGDEMKKDQLCKFANRLLGDITLASTWAPFVGATHQDAHKLKTAKHFVNLWFNKKIIESFFEVCVQDRERKLFWLDYVEYVSNFMIVGSTATKKLLQGDSRVSGVFLSHFIQTDSHTAKTSALVLFIKDKMIVEFSDTGALYVYNQNHEKVKLITRKKKEITKTSDLKETSMENLVYSEDWGYTENYEEGKMRHIGYWQDRLKGWMQEKIVSSHKISVTFFDSQDDELFKARPLPKVEINPVVITKEVQKPKYNDEPEPIQYTEHVATSTANTPISRKSATSNVLSPKKAKNAIYETNISYSISSKWVVNEKCRVVCNARGFYLNVSSGRQYVHLCPLALGILPAGSIWIKRPNLSGWQMIVHSVNGSEKLVGYIKEGGGGILYKQDLSQTDSMFVKLI